MQPPVPVVILITSDLAYGRSERKVRNSKGVKIIDNGIISQGEDCYGGEPGFPAGRNNGTKQRASNGLLVFLMKLGFLDIQRPRSSSVAAPST